MKATTQCAYTLKKIKSPKVRFILWLNRDTHKAPVPVLTPVKPQRSRMWVHIVCVLPAVYHHGTIHPEREHFPGFILHVNCIQCQERGTNSIPGTEMPQNSLGINPSTTRIKAGVGNNNPQGEPTTMSNSKQTLHHPSTARPPLGAPLSQAVQREALPLWYIGFPYTQVTHLICYLLKPPNLAAEGDCMIAKKIEEN